MAVPNIFANVTTSIPLSQLDTNFATAITLGNTAVYLGNTTTTLGNLTLTNVTLSSGTNNIGSTSVSNGTSNVSIVSSGGNITMGTNGSQRVQVITDGVVRVITTGTSNPTYSFTNYGEGLMFSNGDNAGTRYSDIVSLANTPAGATSNLRFWTNQGGGAGTATEKMRIDSNGNLILGSNTSTTANNVLNLYSPTSTLNGIYINKGAQVECQIGFKTGTNTDFFIGTGSTTMGTNGVYLANAGNSWTSVSDERQKDIIEPIENALTKVNTLRAVIGKYKHDADGVRRSFLIAQDVQAVLPEAVRAQDDEEALLGLSYTDVIPLLVASIKELKSQNDALTARIVALETNNGA